MRLFKSVLQLEFYTVILSVMPCLAQWQGSMFHRLLPATLALVQQLLSFLFRFEKFLWRNSCGGHYRCTRRGSYDPAGARKRNTYITQPVNEKMLCWALTYSHQGRCIYNTRPFSCGDQPTPRISNETVGYWNDQEHNQNTEVCDSRLNLRNPQTQIVLVSPRSAMKAAAVLARLTSLKPPEP